MQWFHEAQSPGVSRQYCAGFLYEVLRKRYICIKLLKSTGLRMGVSWGMFHLFIKLQPKTSDKNQLYFFSETIARPYAEVFDITLRSHNGNDWIGGWGKNAGVSVPRGHMVGSQPFGCWPAAETPMCSCCAAGQHLWPLVLPLGQGAPSSHAWRIHVSAEITWQLGREHWLFP